MAVDLQWAEVDDVTTIWVDAPAPLRAGLLFRTGQIDETLVTSGKTHLIEHLVLAKLGDASPGHNGFVAGTASGFIKIGEPGDVADFFAKICEALNSLPGDRLDSEKQVLAAEVAARQYDFRSNLLTARYGARGFGLLGLRQLGIRGATLEQLQEYSAERFTKENAVLWLSGPPPNGLRLNLPHGKKQPLPPLTVVQPTLPGWLVDNGCGGVAGSATVPRVFASSIFCEIASKRLRTRLRTAEAVSYSPSVFYEPLTADTAHLVLHADSEREQRAELTRLFGEIFTELGEVEESEVDEARNRIRDVWAGSLAPSPADRMVLEVQRAAMDWILGHAFMPLEENAIRLSAVTAADVAAFGKGMQETVIFALPSGIALQPWFGEQISTSTGLIVRGRKIVNSDWPIHRHRLVQGPNGVSLIYPDGKHSTVRYSDLAAAVFFEDGGIHLVGLDASVVEVEPGLWRGGQRLCQEIRAQVPAHLSVEQRSRPAEAIPRPRTTAWQRFWARLLQR